MQGISTNNTLNRVLVFLGACLAALGGYLGTHGIVYLAAVAALAGVVTLVALGTYLEHIFMSALAILLFGFMFQSRLFAYIGVPPLFISEIVLALGLLAFVFARARVRFNGLELLILAFLTMGFVRTVPFVREYGIMALRDFAQVYYAFFALLVAFLLSRTQLQRFLRLYANVLPWLVLWIFLSPFIAILFGDSLPKFLNTEMTFPDLLKAGDRAVFLSGMAVFVSSGLYWRFRTRFRIPSLVFWMLWLGAVASVIVANRGGMLALLVSLGLAQLLIPSREWAKAVILAAVAVLVFVIVNPTINVGSERLLNVNQIVANIISIFSDDVNAPGHVSGTRDWRLAWWTMIWDETVRGPRFWDGLGFGENLAERYGFRYFDDEQLRSPHNSHITILARMGVPGLILWIGMQGLFFWRMIQSFRVAKAANMIWAQVIVWLLAIWTAVHVNTAFDVYLEGPQGAIPFWCVFGAGLAVMRFVAEDCRKSKPFTSGSRLEGSVHAGSPGPQSL